MAYVPPHKRTAIMLTGDFKLDLTFECYVCERKCENEKEFYSKTCKHRWCSQCVGYDIVSMGAMKFIPSHGLCPVCFVKNAFKSPKFSSKLPYD